MLAKIISLLAPPKFGDDKDKNLRAQFINVILLANSFVLVLFIFLIRPITSPDGLFSINNLALFLLLLVLVGLLWILRRGHIRLTSYVLISCTWLGIAYLAAINDGIRDTTFVFLLVPILVTSILHGWRASVALIAITIMTGWGFAVAESAGYIAPDADTPGQIARDLTILIIMMAVLIYLIISNLQNALTETRQSCNDLRALSTDLDRRTVELARANIQLREEIKEREQAEQKINRLNSELEKRVIERTAQLEAANKELEAFSYSVSHDLRAPLRHINGFIQLLRKQEGSKLDEASARYLAIITDASKKMGELIDDLLAFSRTGRTEMQIQPMDMVKLVQEVLDEMTLDLNDRNITWEIESLPCAQGDPALLRQVWANLLANAIKYTSTRPEAHIEIGTIPASADAEITFFVRDDGVGFDPSYKDKLFGVFQRLHREDEFPGAGIGLATVRRIIHRHGGQIWAEGEVDRGASFFFTLTQMNTLQHKE